MKFAIQDQTRFGFNGGTLAAPIHSMTRGFVIRRQFPRIVRRLVARGLICGGLAETNVDTAPGALGVDGQNNDQC